MPRSSRSALAASALSAAAALTAPALAQVEFTSASRTVTASSGSTGSPPHVITYTTSDLGLWEATADVGGADAWQRSAIGEGTIEYRSWCGSGGGAGHSASSSSELTTVFTLDTACRWDALVSYDGAWTMAMAQLTRVRDGADMAPGVRWDFEGAYSGYLDAGEYRFRTSLGSVNAGQSFNYNVTVGFRVPAPASLAVLAGVPVLLGRRRTPCEERRRAAEST